MFCFNPLGMLAGGLPRLYLMSWPILVQLFGHELLKRHSLVFILFTLVSDVTRNLMHQLIGLDCLSQMAGLSLLVALLTHDGRWFLDLLQPGYNSALFLSEPIFSLLEIVILMELVTSFGRWLSHKANEVSDDSESSITWTDLNEDNYTRSARIYRVLIIMLSIACYIITFFIFKQTYTLLPANGPPVMFTHALIGFTTFHTLAIVVTLFKDNGIITNPAFTAIVASGPIYLAAWFYHDRHILEEQKRSSSWSSWMPSWSGGSSAAHNLLVPSHFTADHIALLSDSSQPVATLIDGVGVVPGTPSFTTNPPQNVDELARALTERLVALVAFLLGVSWSYVAQFYAFGSHFWSILVVRLACLAWWTQSRVSGPVAPRRRKRHSQQSSPKSKIRQLREVGLASGWLSSSPTTTTTAPATKQSTATSNSDNEDADDESSLFATSGAEDSRANVSGHTSSVELNHGLARRAYYGTRHLAVTCAHWLTLGGRVPVGRATLIKVLVVLVYTRMLIEHLPGASEGVASVAQRKALAEFAFSSPSSSSLSGSMDSPIADQVQRWAANTWSWLGHTLSYLSVQDCHFDTQQGGPASSTWWTTLVANLTQVWHAWASEPTLSLVHIRLVQSLLVHLYYLAHMALE